MFVFLTLIACVLLEYFREAVGECISGVVMATSDGDITDGDDDSVIVRFQRHRENKMYDKFLQNTIYITQSCLAA